MPTRATTVVVAELDDEDPSSRAMLGDLEELDDAGESGLAREGWRDVGEGDLEDLRDDDGAGGQRVAAADLHAPALPEADGGGDLASTNAVAERAKELHL